MDTMPIMLMALVVGALVVGVVAEALISAATEGLRPPDSTSVTAPARRRPPDRRQ